MDVSTIVVVSPLLRPWVHVCVHMSCVTFLVVWGLYTGCVPTQVPTPGLPSQANAYAKGSLCWMPTRDAYAGYRHHQL